MEDSTLLNKAPNPDKLKNKLAIEQEWAKKILNKEDYESVLAKQLDKLDNPLQIWIKAQALKSLNCTYFQFFINKAKDLGYQSDIVIKLEEPTIVGNGIVEGLNSTKFSDGTHVFSTKNPDLIKAINELASGFVTSDTNKQVLQYPENDTTLNFNMFLNSDIKVEEPKYDNNALIALINNDHFLKFNYQNLTTGDQAKDLDMIFNSYIKGDDLMLNKLKQFEQLVSYNEGIQSNKINFFNDFKTLLVENKLDKLINANSLSITLNQYILENKKAFDQFLSTFKVEWKNISFNQTLSDIYKVVSETKIAYSDVLDNKAIDKLSEHIKVSYDLSGAMVQGPVTESLNIAKKHLFIGEKESTKLFNIVLAVLLKEIPA